MSFLGVRCCDPKICLRETPPIAGFAEVFQCSLSVVARDRIFADTAIDARQRRVDWSRLWLSAALGRISQSGFENSDSLRMITIIIVGKTDLYSERANRLLVEFGS